MTDEIRAQAAEFERKAHALETDLATLRQRRQELQEKIAPYEAEMAKLERAIDAIRHSEEYKELMEKLPHLRKVVGGG